MRSCTVYVRIRLSGAKDLQYLETKRSETKRLETEDGGSERKGQSKEDGSSEKKTEVGGRERKGQLTEAKESSILWRAYVRLQYFGKEISTAYMIEDHLVWLW